MAGLTTPKGCHCPPKRRKIWRQNTRGGFYGPQGSLQPQAMQSWSFHQGPAAHVRRCPRCTPVYGGLTAVAPQRSNPFTYLAIAG